MFAKNRRRERRCDIIQYFKDNFKYSKLSWKGTPIIASNMDGVGEIGIAKKLTSHKIMTALTKQHSINQISKIII